MKILFYASATNAYLFKELVKLSLHDNHDISVIVPRGQYKNYFDDILPKDKILYLFENFDKSFTNYTDITFGKDGDNIYKILSSDKDGYIHEDHAYQLNNAQTIYNIYTDFLLENRPEYIVFPDVETVDGLILMSLCYKLSIKPLYFVHTRLLGMSFISHSCYEQMPKYFGNYTENDIIKAKELVEAVASGKKINPMNTTIKSKDSNIVRIKVPSLIKRILKSYYIRFKYEKHYRGEDNFFQKIRTNVLPLVEAYRHTKYIICQKGFFDIVEIGQLPKNFILFALQITPESSINTLEQYFVEQEKAINLIRLNMPHNFYVVVKEHPGMKGIRKSSFYKNLRKKPGILLCDIQVSTTEVVDKSQLVASITGTIGLECYLQNKPCLLFGRNFFSPLCYTFDSYKNFKHELHKMIFDHKHPTKEEKIIELAKIYNVSYDFIVHEPFHYPMVMSTENISNVYTAIFNHISRLEEHHLCALS